MIPDTVSVVIPVYNESANIMAVLNDIFSTAASRHLRVQVIAVDDGSRDDSWQVLQEAKQHYPDLLIDQHPINQGFGAALRTGIKHSTGDYWTFLPSDGELKMAELFKLLPVVDGHAAILGVRRAANLETYRAVRPWYRELISWANSSITKLAIGSVTQGDEGFYLIRTSQIKSFDLRSTSGLIVLEVLYYCRKFKIPVKRIPIAISARISGVSKVMNLRGILRQTWDTLKLAAFLRTKAIFSFRSQET